MDIVKENQRVKPPFLKPEGPGLPFENINGRWFLQEPLYGRTYIRDKRGFKLDPNSGEIEAGDAKLVGGSGIGGGFAVVKQGDDIQSAVERVHNAGDGTVFLNAGTHPRKTDLVLYSHITLEGLTADGAIINFDNNAAGIKIVGSNAYSAGTVTIASGAITVEGIGTTFTSAMVGRSILLGAIWYTISGFTDLDTITINIPFAGEALSGSSYTIATTIDDCFLRRITVKNSTSQAIKYQYANELTFDNVKTQTSAVGMKGDDSSNIGIYEYDGIANTANMQMTNVHLLQIDPAGGVDTTNDDFVFSNCHDCEISPLFSFRAGGVGYKFTDCSDIGGNTLDAVKSGSHGFEFVSGNARIKIAQSAAKGCVGDGVKLTATTDDCSFRDFIVKDNGGYGFNVAASSCDNNDIIDPTISGNTSGLIADSGVGTKIQIKGGDPTINKDFRRMKNTSGGALATGDLVILKAVAAGDEVTTTTTQGDDKVCGMAVETIANDAYGRIQILGKTIALKVDGTTDIAIGDFIGTFTTAKIGRKAVKGDMAIAIALEAYATDDSSGVIDAILIPPRKIAAPTGNVNMANTVVLNDSAGSTTFTDLDLSSVVGATTALVMLKVKNTDAAVNDSFAVRPNGDADDYFGSDTGGATKIQLNVSEAGILMVKTDSAGVIEWRTGSANTETTMTVLGYWTA